MSAVPKNLEEWQAWMKVHLPHDGDRPYEAFVKLAHAHAFMLGALIDLYCEGRQLIDRIAIGAQAVGHEKKP